MNVKSGYENSATGGGQTANRGGRRHKHVRYPVYKHKNV